MASALFKHIATASRVHGFTHFIHNETLVIVWKFLLSAFLVSSIDVHNQQLSSLFQTIWVALFLFGILCYFIISLYLIGCVQNNKLGVFISQNDDLTLFANIIGSNWCLIEWKFVIIQHLSLAIGIFCYLIAWLLQPIAFNYFFLCTSAFFLVYIVISVYLAMKRFRMDSMDLFACIPQCIFIFWIVTCCILAFDFDMDIHSLYITVPIILYIMFNSMYRACKQVSYEDENGLGMCPFCPSGFFATCECCVYVPFFIIWCIYFADPSLITPSFISFAFVCIWLAFIFQIFRNYCSVTNHLREGYLLIDDNKKINEVMVSKITNDDFLNELNHALDERINALSSKYRLRDEWIRHIICPNQASLDQNAYDSVLMTLDEEYYVQNNAGTIQSHYVHYVCDEYHDIPSFFQWLPTEFRCKFKQNIIEPERYQDMKMDFMDIELASPYIPDINQYRFPKLNAVIIDALKQMLPLFFGSITRDRFGNSDTYKQLMFDWCKSKKILRFVIKSQQHELSGSDRVNYDSTYHIEGTIQEKIAFVGILYSLISESVRGGSLYLRYDAEHWNRDWKLKPFEGSMIVFPNMPHCIKDLSQWDKGCNGLRRSLAFFMLFDEDMARYNSKMSEDWHQNEACKWMLHGKEGDPWSSYDERNDDPYWKYLVDCGNLPLLTASDVLPMDRNHFDAMFDDCLGKNVKNVFGMELPQIVIEIVKLYVVDDAMLKNEEGLYENGINMRRSRGYGQRANQKYMWRRTKAYMN